MAVIGVMGSGSRPWNRLATPLGAWIAKAGHHLLTGGGQGVMASVGKAFHGHPGRRGCAIGVLPTLADPERGYLPLVGYPNAHVDIRIVTPLPRRAASDPPDLLTRNHVNVLSSDVVVALPGAHGTRDEVRLCLQFRKPVIGFGPLAQFAEMPGDLLVVQRLEGVVAFIEDQLKA
ncbi:DNA-binding protein [Hydrogenophaga sp.]|uniref:SLOG cluster 4 domain-containing protein n=1 Tax=Hydrogenophaga sp. TaxID=1904254 RepID=UPI002FC73318